MEITHIYDSSRNFPKLPDFGNRFFLPVLLLLKKNGKVGKIVGNVKFSKQTEVENDST